MEAAVVQAVVVAAARGGCGGEGKVLGGLMTVTSLATGKVLGSAVTDSTLGLVTIAPCGTDLPVLVTLSDLKPIQTYANMMQHSSKYILQECLPELAIHTGRSVDQLREDGLDLADFKRGILRVELPDGSFVQFHSAFHILNLRHKAIAVFTEHCGYHVFPCHDAKIYRDGELVYADRQA